MFQPSPSSSLGGPSRVRFQEFTNLVKINGRPVSCGMLELTIDLFHVVNTRVITRGKNIAKTFIQLPEIIFSYPIFKILRILCFDK